MIRGCYRDMNRFYIHPDAGHSIPVATVRFFGMKAIVTRSLVKGDHEP